MKGKRLFKQYVLQYNNKIKQFDYDWKVIHSYRVAELCSIIATKEGLSNHDIELATTCGLFHDIGRFPQLSSFHSYNDHTFKDHGDLGYNIIINDKIFHNILSKKDQQIVAIATKYHNKYSLPNAIKKEERLFCEIVRDADKIDIIKGMLEGNILYKEEDKPISKEVLDDIKLNKLVLWSHIKSNSDYLSELFSYAFDINKKSSLKLIQEEDLFNRLYNLVNNKSYLQDVDKKVNNYIKGEILC